MIFEHGFLTMFGIKTELIMLNAFRVVTKGIVLSKHDIPSRDIHLIYPSTLFGTNTFTYELMSFKCGMERYAQAIHEMYLVCKLCYLVIKNI